MSTASQRAPWQYLAGWLRAFRPAPMAVNAQERWRVVCGAGLGVLITAVLCHLAGAGWAELPWLVAPMGASAVLVFGVPASPLLGAAGGAYNNATRRRYPHAQLASSTATKPERALVSEADLDAVLARYNQVLDVPRDDLRALLEEAELRAYRRRLGEIRCEDIMSRDLATVEYGTPLQDAWALLRERRIKALPVVDTVRRVVGIVTLADFMREAQLDLHEGFEDKLRRLIRWTLATHSSKPEVVGQIMTRQVRVASAHRHIAELVPMFSDTGHHHIPIIDAERRLVGIITQSDLVKALTRVGPD
jgi:CBS domain-containing membrane protein